MVYERAMLPRTLSCLQLLGLVLVLVGCQSGSQSAEPAGTETVFHEPATLAAVEASSTVQQGTPRSLSVVKPDPYAGWETWCEPIDHHSKPCQTKADCSGYHSRCTIPRWARKAGTLDVKMCAARWPGPKEQRWRRARLRVIVDSLCQPPEWWDEKKDGNGKRCWRFGWRRAKQCMARKWCNPVKLHRFLRIVALRESTWRPWKRHRLNPDIVAAKTAWSRRSRKYGWILDEGKARRRVHDPNEHFLKRHRWMGLGLYGQNAALWVTGWDAHAPPEILCREPESTETYLRRARSVWRKIRGGLDCDRDGKPDFWGSAQRYTPNVAWRPSWADIHRGTSGGRLCPNDRPSSFIRRARTIKLDAQAPVEFAMLGRQVPKEGQQAWADATRVATAAISR